MISIQTYLYNQTVDIQILDTGIYTVRNRAVYVRPIKIYQGIDNPIVVSVRNQDQKPLNVTNFRVEAAIQDSTIESTIETFPVVWSDIIHGAGYFTIPRTTLDILDLRFYQITFKIINSSNNTERPMYTDANYGVPLEVEVLPAYYSTANVKDTTVYTIDAGTI